MRELLRVTYGSKLYGTDTPASDTDIKVVYLPEFKDVLLGKKHSTYKKRWDGEGQLITDDKQPMPNNGVEIEFIPFQVFTRDFLGGQTYALELVFSQMSKTEDVDGWLISLAMNFLTANVASMAGFAQKQTMDYVHRGQRLQQALTIEEALGTLERLAVGFYTIPNPRLDTIVEGVSLLARLVALTGAELGTTVNNGRTLLTLKLNGREYLETTTLQHLTTAVEKLISSYGERSAEAGKKDVDWKSLSHAVRVYEQAQELLTTGKITFPRTNAVELLAIKQGETNIELVKARLLTLEDSVNMLQEMNPLGLQTRSVQLDRYFDDWLLHQLYGFYGLHGD
jgi:hypothetical protein